MMQLNEAEKIFDLLENLIDGQNTRYRYDVNPNMIWRAHFIGNPSLRHANRISILRDFLNSLLPEDVEIVASGTEGVIIEFAPSSVMSRNFVDASKKIFDVPEIFSEISQRIGLLSVSFSDTELKITSDA